MKYLHHIRAVFRCNAVHPGYGFLSENAESVDLCEQSSIAFLGPKSDTLHQICAVFRCKAVHTGYGFLSEQAEFVDLCEQNASEIFGPKSDTMRLFSRKHDARAFAKNAKVPILAGQLFKLGLMHPRHRKLFVALFAFNCLLCISARSSVVALKLVCQVACNSCPAFESALKSNTFSSLPEHACSSAQT